MNITPLKSTVFQLELTTDEYDTIAAVVVDVEKALIGVFTGFVDSCVTSRLKIDIGKLAQLSPADQDAIRAQIEAKL